MAKKVLVLMGSASDTETDVAVHGIPLTCALRGVDSDSARSPRSRPRPRFRSFLPPRSRGSSTVPSPLPSRTS